MSRGFLAQGGAIGVSSLAVSFGLGPNPGIPPPIVVAPPINVGGIPYRNWDEYVDIVLGRMRKSATLGDEKTIDLDEWFRNQVPETDIPTRKVPRKPEENITSDKPSQKKQQKKPVVYALHVERSEQKPSVAKLALLTYMTYLIRVPIHPTSILLTLLGVRMYKK
jgi:hypothetical protein